jgi:hypothetical protein
LRWRETDAAGPLAVARGLFAVVERIVVCPLAEL